MATGGWVADLDKKEHKNWVIVGCALNITKNGITSKVQTKMEAWYQSLISSPPLNSLTPCACSSRGPKCRTCVTWESELTRHHTSKRPTICWGNSDRKQWGSPAGTWEIAKVFMPTLGSRKKDVVDARTTDIGGLLNLLEWCPFIKPPVNGKVLSLARDQCRNHWAHAPKQELKHADVLSIFGHLNSLLSDPLFTADKAAQSAGKDLQDLFRQGLVNIRDSEVEALHLLRQSLVADLTKCQDDLTDVQDRVVQLDAETKKGNTIFEKDICELKEKGNTSSEQVNNLSERVKEMEVAVKEQSNINKDKIDRIEANLTDAKENLSLEISTILRAVDDFNKELNERDDLRGTLKVIREDVDDVRNGIDSFLEELTTTKSRVANLDTSIVSVKREVKEVKCGLKEIADEITSNRNTISSLQSDVMDVKEEVETLKVNASKPNVDDGHSLCTAPRRLTAFTGRKTALEWLERNLISQTRGNQQGTSCSTKAICGLGGCGKTSLAVEFAWRYMGRFPGGVFWINAESDENIQRSVVEILALENIPASTAENIDDTLNRFLTWLCKKTVPWLLVMDNADDLQGSVLPTGVKKICRGSWQRNGNAFKQGHILFTTRQNAKDTRSFLKVLCDDCLELECFSEEEGAQFLIKRIGVKEESHDPGAIPLVNELGALPLALEQAAAFIDASPIPLSFKDYHEKYQAVKLRLLSQQPATALSVEAQHRLSVHTTWQINFEFVKKQSPAAASMMYIVAFLQSENVPFDVINPGFPELDQEDLRECARSKLDIASMLRVLSSYSLFSVDDPSRTFSVHKLVQEVIRDSLTSAGRIEALGAAIQVLHLALREKSDPCFRFGKYDSLAKSSKLMIGNLSEIKEEEGSILINLVLNFRQLKNYLEDEVNSPKRNFLFNDYTLELCDLVRSLLRNNVFFCRLQAEFSDFHLKVVRILGNSDPNSLLESMVITCVSKRNFTGRESHEEAKKLAQETVKKLHELENSGAVITSDTKYKVLEHMASYYAVEGDWEKSYKALLELEHLPMSDHNIVDLQILIARAENYMSTGNFQRVLRRYEKALELGRRIYPSDHCELVRVLQFITSHFQLAQKFQEARPYAEELLEVAKKQPTASNPYFKGVTSALSILSHFDPYSAEVTLLHILEDRWPLLHTGSTSQMVDSQIDSCCADLVDEGSADQAAIVLEQLLVCFTIMLTSSSQPIDRTNLENKEKVNFYRRAAEILYSIQTKLLGDVHPQMRDVYGFLVVVHQLLGNWEEVEKFVEKMTQCIGSSCNNYFSEARADESVLYAREYKDRGNNFFKSRDYAKALENYNTALRLCPNDTVLLTNRAATYIKVSQNGQNKESEQHNLFKHALEDSKKAIAADSTWMKGYYWKAVCLAKLRERGPSLAAAAIAEHLFPSKCTQIPAVVEQFGGYNATVVNTVDDLLFVPETTESNRVILVKEGIYEVPTPLRVQKNAVIVGVGDVQIVCSNGVPLQQLESAYIENVTLSPKTESTTKLKERAKECLNRGQLNTALSLYSEALTKCPNDAVLLTNRAVTYFKLSKRGQNQAGEQHSLFERALEDSEKAIAADPSWVKGYYWKAVCLAKLKERAPSLAAAAIAEHLFPSQCTQISAVVEQYGGYNATEVRTAEDLVCALATADHTHVILVKEGRYDVPTPQRVPSNAVIVGVGDVQIICISGVPLQADETVYIENITLSPTMESIRELKNRAKECRNRGHLDSALTLYSEALTKCPNDAQLLTARATTYLKSANKQKDLPSERRRLLELALKDSEAAIVANSSWVLGYYNKAASLAELGRKQQALAAAAVFKHLSCGRDIPVVIQRFGDVGVQAVQNSSELQGVLHRIEELQEVDQVVLLKEGVYLLDKTVEVAQPIVIVGHGKVTVSCQTGRSPFNFTQEHYVENVELCEDLQKCSDSNNIQAEVISLPGLSENEWPNLSSECKVN